MAAVWDTATVSAVTLSGGNLVATNTGTTSTNQGAHVAFANGQTTGKYYFEVTLTTLTGGADTIGVASTTATYTGLSTGATQGVVAFTNTGRAWVDSAGNVGPATGGAMSTGQVISVAADLTNRRVWFRLAPSGLWNNSGSQDPTDGTGGHGGYGLVAGTIVPFVTFGNGYVGSGGVSGNAFTANFGDSAFVGAVPSGYTAGWPPLGPPPVELAGNLGGSSYYGKLSYGKAPYSRISAFAPIFAADVIVTPAIGLSGDLHPVVSFGADLSVGHSVAFSGGLAPIIVLAADLDVHVNLIDFAGGIAPQIALGGSLSLDLPLTALEGGLTPNVVLGASSFVSGPLWEDAELCPPPVWGLSDPCPPPPWMISAPCDPVVWSKSEMCNG